MQLVSSFWEMEVNEYMTENQGTRRKSRGQCSVITLWGSPVETPEPHSNYLQFLFLLSFFSYLFCLRQLLSKWYTVHSIAWGKFFPTTALLLWKLKGPSLGKSSKPPPKPWQTPEPWQTPVVAVTGSMSSSAGNAGLLMEWFPDRAVGSLLLVNTTTSGGISQLRGECDIIYCLLMWKQQPASCSRCHQGRQKAANGPVFVLRGQNARGLWVKISKQLPNVWVVAFLSRFLHSVSFGHCHFLRLVS